jgi:hypothetical protein
MQGSTIICNDPNVTFPIVDLFVRDTIIYMIEGDNAGTAALVLYDTSGNFLSVSDTTPIGGTSGQALTGLP